jgi:hypothetical protein
MELIDQLDLVTRQAVQNFSSLNGEQLNWKPDPSTWSIAQCLDHLIVSNTTYFPTFDKLLRYEYSLPLAQRLNPFKKLLGPVMVKNLGPQLAKKFKNPKIFDPSSSTISTDILNNFTQHQEVVKNYFRQLLRLDTNNLVITSPVTSVITYSLQDGLQIIAGHEQRHINQALNIFNHPNFPK